jgi:hypothetical protein
MHHRTVFAGAALAALLLAGCGTPVALRTAREPNDVCMMALLVGTLVRDPETGLGVSGGRGEATPVLWPFGYTARLELDKVVLADETGRTIAREGDQVSLGGGSGADELWRACPGVDVMQPSPGTAS